MLLHPSCEVQSHIKILVGIKEAKRKTMCWFSETLKWKSQLRKRTRFFSDMRRGYVIRWREFVIIRNLKKSHSEIDSFAIWISDYIFHLPTSGSENAKNNNFETFLLLDCRMCSIAVCHNLLKTWASKNNIEGLFLNGAFLNSELSQRRSILIYKTVVENHG